MAHFLSQITKLLVAATLSFAVVDAATACTGITFSAEMELLGGGVQMNYFAGRTMEFGPDVAYWKLIYAPKDSTYESCKLSSLDFRVLDTCVREIETKALNKKYEKKYEKVKGYSWKALYSYVGFAPMKYLKDPSDPTKKFEYTLAEINDGINEKGLYCGGLYHMGFEQYSNRPSGLLGQKNISNMDFIAWVLGRFSNVTELEAELPFLDVRLFDVELYQRAIEPEKVPHLHYHVADIQGNAIVIEFVDGKAKVFNSVGVITNNPTYDWQVMNLRNYVGLQTNNHESTVFMNNSTNKLSNGTGGIGLPGDFTSTSRFIRAMYLLNATVTNNKISSPGEAIARSFKILNQFDIPEGSVVELKEKHKKHLLMEATSNQLDIPEESAAELKKRQKKAPTMEATSWTSMADLKGLRYYYHTMLNRTVRMIDLGELIKRKDLTAPVTIELPQYELVIDETPQFAPAQK